MGTRKWRRYPSTILPTEDESRASQDPHPGGTRGYPWGWRLQCPATADDLVFPAAGGRPMRRSSALPYGLWSALRRAGLRWVNMHSLRHSFASALIMIDHGRGGVTEVQALLGHASPAITARIYSQLRRWTAGRWAGSVS